MNDEMQPLDSRERLFRRERRSVPLAREFVRAVLAGWGVGESAEAVLLCVSELATNAVRHGVPPGRGFRLWLRREADGTLRVEVHDSGDGCPRVLTAGPGDEGGRGLLLVEALADKWGVGERDPGKIVWCEFALRGEPHTEGDPRGLTTRPRKA
ncbi:ATP-binding protein [Streptomyces sp. NPDC017993]|uniref:ATP-binding protein n=1 Tax=Streptomyces sp. NPDC017993 TaxID=3365027 RepID=UPI0037B77B1B